MGAETYRCEDGPDGCLLDVRVLPRGKSDEVVGVRARRLCLRTTAPPVEGAANARVQAFMAKTLGVRKSQVAIVSGETAREKTLRIRGLSCAELAARLRL